MLKRFQLRVLSILALMTAVVLMNTRASAQIEQPRGYEREFKMSDEYFSVISLNEDGVALLQERNKYEGGKQLWQAIVLDTALTEQYTIEFKVDDRFSLAGYEVLNGHLYLLFRAAETYKNYINLVDLDITQGKEGDRHEIKPEVELKITQFSIVDHTAIFGGYVTNDPALLLYDIESKNLKIVPGFFQKDTELVEVRVNENNTFNVILVDRSSRAERKLLFRTFDPNGKLLLEDAVSIGDDVTVQASISSRLKREDLMVLGTWSSKHSKQSAGFFAMPVNPFADQEIKYYYYGELEHFLDYLPAKRAQRIKSKTKRDLSEGSNPSFVTSVVPYKVTERKEGYLLLAEVYNPTNTNNLYYTTPYANPYYPNPYLMTSPYWPNYYRGMRYRPPSYNTNTRNNEKVETFATVLAAFDADGKLLWDQSIKLDDVDKNTIEQVSDFYYDSNHVTFIYKKESALRIKTISVSDGDVHEITEKIRLSSELDEVRNEKESEGGIKHWNENSFYVWGYQTIKNPSKKDDRVRDVFYINKIVVR